MDLDLTFVVEHPDAPLTVTLTAPDTSSAILLNDYVACANDGEALVDDTRRYFVSEMINETISANTCDESTLADLGRSCTDDVLYYRIVKVRSDGWGVLFPLVLIALAPANETAASPFVCRRRRTCRSSATSCRLAPGPSASARTHSGAVGVRACA